MKINMNKLLKDLSNDSKYPHVNNVSESFYDEKIFNAESGKFVAEKPQLLVFVDTGRRQHMTTCYFLRELE